MDVIITQIRDLHAQATPQARAKIQEDLRDLLSSFESDWDLLLGMASGVGSPLPLPLRPLSSSTHLTPARTCACPS